MAFTISRSQFGKLLVVGLPWRRVFMAHPTITVTERCYLKRNWEYCKAVKIMLNIRLRTYLFCENLTQLFAQYSDVFVFFISNIIIFKVDWLLNHQIFLYLLWKDGNRCWLLQLPLPPLPLYACNLITEDNKIENRQFRIAIAVMHIKTVRKS